MSPGIDFPKGVFFIKQIVYSGGMNELIQLALPLSQHRGLSLILTRDKARASKTALIATLILKGPLFVVSGDEWLPSFLLPHTLREATTDIRAILSRLYTARASTCYRLFDALASIPSKGEPVLVMDFLHTFYDADIPLRLRLFKLRECCRELKRLALYRPVIVLTQEREAEDCDKFIPALGSIADTTVTLDPEFERIGQPALF